ncbi:hypothetical protein LguiB_017656 [Lonicera macranthoides]
MPIPKIAAVNFEPVNVNQEQNNTFIKNKELNVFMVDSKEILEHVFSFRNTDKDRNTVSMVNKSWYEIERWCRRRIFIGNCYSVSPNSMIRRFPEVRSVEIKGKPHFADFNLVPEGWGAYVYPWISAMARAYPSLEEIRLKMMVVSKGVVRNLNIE